MLGHVRLGVSFHVTSLEKVVYTGNFRIYSESLYGNALNTRCFITKCDALLLGIKHVDTGCPQRLEKLENGQENKIVFQRGRPEKLGKFF